MAGKYYNESARKSTYKYLKANSYPICFRLSKLYEQDLIDIYKGMPRSEKSEWFKQCLRDYAKKHQ